MIENKVTEDRQRLLTLLAAKRDIASFLHDKQRHLAAIRRSAEFVEKGGAPGELVISVARRISLALRAPSLWREGDPLLAGECSGLRILMPF